MSPETILTNARIVTPEAVIEGTLVVRDGVIAAIEAGNSTVPAATDLEDDWLLPGFVELHTDNLERQFEPRPKVRWPADAAMMQHDAQVAAAGITTVCDAVCVGFYGGRSERLGYLSQSLDVLRRARAAGVLKAEHRLHLRLELPDPHLLELLEPLLAEPDLALVSFMDHTPGQRQWRDPEKHKAFMRHELRDDDAYSAMALDRQEQQRRLLGPHKRRVLELLGDHPAVRASHDDTTEDHVAEARAMGVSISEFPTTLEAARAAKEAGMTTVMGAPNLVIGGSHSGNVAALTLAAEGLLDAFSSDYVPASLAQSIPLLRDSLELALPEAIAPVTRNPAAMLGLADRGRLAPDLRADLVRLSERAGTPAVRAVWRQGQRIA